jgi:hypothetical protein
MKFSTAAAIAVVSTALVVSPLASASANDGRHLAFGLGAVVGALALIITAPFRALAEAPAPRPAYYAPAPAYYAPPVAYYPPPVVYYPPPGYGYAPPPGYAYPQR